MSNKTKSEAKMEVSISTSLLYHAFAIRKGFKSYRTLYEKGSPDSTTNAVTCEQVQKKHAKA